MKYIKAYEMFDFSQTLPTTSQDVLTSYYHCDGCNALYKSVNSTEDDCKFCNSRELEELSEDEYYDTIGERLDDDDDDDDFGFESPFCKPCEGTGCEECDGSGMKRNSVVNNDYKRP